MGFGFSEINVEPNCSLSFAVPWSHRKGEGKHYKSARREGKLWRLEDFFSFTATSLFYNCLRVLCDFINSFYYLRFTQSFIGQVSWGDGGRACGGGVGVGLHSSFLSRLLYILGTTSAGDHPFSDRSVKQEPISTHQPRFSLAVI